MKSVAVFHKIHGSASSSSLSSDSESETVALSYSFSISTGTRLLKYSLNFELSSLFEKAIIEDAKASKCSAAFFFLVVCKFVAHIEAAATKSEAVLPLSRLRRFVTMRDPLEAALSTSPDVGWHGSTCSAILRRMGNLTEFLKSPQNVRGSLSLMKQPTSKVFTTW